MSEPSGRGLRGRVAAQTEDTLGKLAQDLLTNPLVSGAIARAFEAREKASQAQEVAFGALNLPSAADIERLTRRLRSVSQRLEGIEDGVDRLDQALGRLSTDHAMQARLTGIEEQLGALVRLVGELRDGLPGTNVPVPLAQERLAMEAAEAEQSASAPRAAPRPARRSKSPANSRKDGRAGSAGANSSKRSSGSGSS